MVLGSRNESTKGQGATLLKITLHTTSRCVNRAEGSLCPGRRNFEIWHLEWSILHDLFFYHRGSISKIPSTVFWFSEAANCIRNPSLKRRKRLFSRTQWVWVAEWDWNSGHCLVNPGHIPLPHTAGPVPTVWKSAHSAHVRMRPLAACAFPGSRMFEFI